MHSTVLLAARLVARVAAPVAALTLLSVAARAGAPEPGSLLLFPEFDQRAGEITLLTLTNVSSTGTIDVHIEYIDASTCQGLDRIVHLTPRDTITILTSAHAPGLARGYAYAVAEDPATHRRIDFDALIGDVQRIDAVHAQAYDIPAIAFQALTGPGQPTDVNLNGFPDLDGIEYERAPRRFYMPRFIGQANDPAPRNTYESELILFQVLANPGTTTTVGFLAWNDNEQAFSASYSFQCWTRVRLLSISGAFAATFLHASNQDPTEVLGNPAMESGWFEVHGVTAQSPQGTLANPPVFGVLVDVFPVSVAEMPFVEHP